MIYALHGFLGLPTDWECFKDLQQPHLALNLFDSPESATLLSFAQDFNQKFADPENILMGYSMGGRLALHALIDSPNAWKAAIIISAHPGLETNQERQSRLKSDEEQFLHFQADFNAALTSWNNQSIFKDSFHFKREKKDFPKAILNQCLDAWSLGRQQDLRHTISTLPMPILWIVGDKDEKFKTLTKELSFLNPISRVWIAKNCAHRVAWETKEFETQVNLFLEDL